jgi:hypothetical protein
MFNASIAQTAAYKVATNFARRLLMTAAIVALPAMANAGFFVLDNPGDLNFNQLLGINGGRLSVILVVAQLLRTTATFWCRKITSEVIARRSWTDPLLDV